MTKTRLFKKVTSLLLAFVLLLGALPFSAAAVGIANASVPGGTPPAVGSTVYFGHYPQSVIGTTEPATGTEGVDWVTKTPDKSSDGFEFNVPHYFKIEPIAWRVLDNSDEQLLLIAEKIVEQLPYNSSSVSPMTWENSNLRAWLNGSGFYDNLYPTNAFINTAFTAKEQAAIASTSVQNLGNPINGLTGGDPTTDKVFLLSIQEATTGAYGFNYFANDAARAATRTPYADCKAFSNHVWWTRSPGDTAGKAALVGGTGVVFAASAAGGYGFAFGIRPAIRINLSEVFFTSDAVDGKADTVDDTLLPASAPAGAMKLTVWDGDTDFASGGEPALTAISGRTITFSYTAAPGSTYNTLTALLTDETGINVLYYGKLAAPPAPAGTPGTATVTIPEDAAISGMLYVILEQINGNGQTDYVGPAGGVVFSNSAPTPGGLGGVACTTPANNDGKITGFSVLDRYDYKPASGTSWTSLSPATELTGLAPGDYHVRYSALPSSVPAALAGPATTITVGAYINPDQTKVDEDKATLTVDSIKGNNADKDNVTGDLSLPTTGTNGSTITWESDQPDVISADGKVTRPAYGQPDVTVTLTATIKSGNVTDTVTITVIVKAKTAPTVTATSVKLAQSSLRLAKKQKATIGAVVYWSDNTGTSESLTWTSSNEKVATVDSNGQITGKKAGKATITATTESGESATLKVTVVAKAVKVTKVAISGSKKPLDVGKTAQLKAKISPSKATNAAVTWKSSKPSVVHVDKAGKITALKEGKAVITLKGGGKTAKVTITVAAPVSKITVDKTKVSLAKKGKTATITPTVTYSQEGYTAKLSWKSSNTKVAMVNSKGKITAKGKGKATITVTASNGKKATVRVTVKK